MTARSAPFFPKTIGTGDGTTKDYDLGFPFLAKENVRIFVNGVLKTQDTDYFILDDRAGSDKASVRFATAPTNGHAIKATRNTPINRYRGNPAISQTDALQAQYRMQEDADKRVRLDWYVNDTDLAAGTAQSIVAPCDGFIEAAQATVVNAAVGTGGDITVEIDGVAVTGLTLTFANSAPIGTVKRDTPTTAQSTTTKVKKGQTITVTPAAAFATTGAVVGFVELQPGDLT